MRIALPGALLAGLAATAAAVLPATAAAADGSPITGHVYVDDNTAGTNTVAVLDRHADGHLTPNPGSPYATPGAGSGSGLTSQGAIQVSPDGRFVITVDAGSDELSVLRIQDGGKLTPVVGGTVSSGGSHPVSVAIHRNLVYVANAGDGASNYTGFRLGANGRLHPIAGSTVALPDGSQPGDVLFSPDGSRLVGTRINTSLIDSFAVGAGGQLTAAPGSPYAAQGVGPFGSEFRPTNSRQLYVSNAHDGPGNGTVSAFDVAADGTLTSIGASPFADNQTAACWVEVSHDGRFLFTVNTASGTISRYAIADGGSLTLLGSTPVAATGGVGAVDAALSPDGASLYVDESRIASVGQFAVNGGDLTELAGPPVALPAGATPAGIAAH
jgi:6-phosphogluconolactonase (cycloisomerase 2 family)